MKRYVGELKHIRELLLKNPRGLTVSEISKKLNINRNSVAKYLDVLTISGNVEVRRVGPAKMFFLSHRVPLPAMLNFSSDYILVFDSNLRIINANDNIINLMKTKRKALLGKGIEECPHPLFSSSGIISKIKKAVNGKDFTMEITFQKAKKEFYFKTKLIPTTFEDGEVGVTMILEDITKSKMMDKKLQESEENLRSLLYSTNDLFFVIGIDGRFKHYYQSSGKRELYIPPDKFIGKHFRDVLPPDVTKLLEDAIKKIETSNKTQQFDYSLTIKGRKLWYNAGVSLAKDQSGNSTGFVAVVRNITKRKKIELELIKAHSAIENSLDAVFTSDFKGRVTYANPAAAKLWGFKDTGEMIGTNVLDYWNKPSCEKVKQIINILKKKGSYSSSEGLFGKRKDGTEFCVIFNVAVMKDKSGKPVGMTGSFDEIKKRKKAY